MRGCSHNKKFAVTGARHRTSRVICIRAATDDRGVANPAAQFIGFASSRSCRRQILVPIEGDSSNRSVQILISDDEFLVAIGAGFFGRLRFLERVPAFLGEKIFRIDQFNAVLLREIFRALATH